MGWAIFWFLYIVIGCGAGWLSYHLFRVNAEWPWWKAGPAIVVCAAAWPLAAGFGLYILLTTDWSH